MDPLKAPLFQAKHFYIVQKLLLEHGFQNPQLGPLPLGLLQLNAQYSKKKKKKANPGTKKLIFKFWKLHLLASLLSSLDLSFLICHMGIMLYYRFILRVSEIINVATLRTLEPRQSIHQCLGTSSQSCSITGTPTCISRKRSFQKWSIVKRMWWSYLFPYSSL